MEILRQFFADAAQTWRRLSASARINILVTFVGVAAVIGALVYMNSRPHFVTLYGGLGAGDAQNIVTYLETSNIPYELADRGATVRVPAHRFTEISLGLRQQGLPAQAVGGPGWELFDTVDLMTNQYVLDINKQRAIQGELMQYLNLFDFIKSSAVWISFAEESLFSKEQLPTTATVQLDTTRTLGREDIDAVLWAVQSFGGAGLSPAHITIQDQNGNVLKAPESDDKIRIATNRLDLIEALESQRAEIVRKSFERMGRNAIVNVTAQVDFSSVTEHSVAYDPENSGTVARSETKNDLETTETAPQGAPGAQANVPADVTLPRDVRTTDSTEELVENLEPGFTERTRVQDPGEIVGYKVAVVLEGDYEPVVGDDGVATGEMDYVPLTEEALETWRQFVANSVGVGVTIEDVTLTQQPFKVNQLRATKEAMAQVSASSWWQADWLGNLVKLILLIAMIFVLRHVLIRMFAVRSGRDEDPSIELPKATPEELRRQEVLADVERVSRDEPQAVAALLRTWMSESEE